MNAKIALEKALERQIFDAGYRLGLENLIDSINREANSGELLFNIPISDKGYKTYVNEVRTQLKKLGYCIYDGETYIIISWENAE